jgi:protein-tyrosine phosphatase
MNGTGAPPGLLNFRDVGGLPAADGARTRPRTLFRSHAPHGLGPAGIAGIRALGLRATLDLRDDSELAEWPYELGDAAIARRHVPVMGDLPVPPCQAELYAHIIENCGAGITAAVRVLAEPGVLPVLVHCAVGKDRTGVTVALALSAVGVPDEAVVEDFLRSNAGLNIPTPVETADGTDDPYKTRRYVRPALIENALELARRRGGDVPGYLASHGMADGELDALRAALVAVGGAG